MTSAILIDRTVPDYGDIARQCVERGYTVHIIPPLYHIPHESDVWPKLAAPQGPKVVLCTINPRPAEWVLRSHGIGDDGVEAMRVSADESVSELVSRICESAGQLSPDESGRLMDLSAAVEQRWYPVLDYSRCTSCGACFQFCIFGVYERDGDGAVIPVEPDNCKLGCPACARICPNSAIMFPLCDDSAIAGAPGEFVEPDGQARQMYYMRTGAKCPKCGGSGEFQPASGGRTCTECGRPLDTDSSEDDAVLSEIDSLIEELDDLAGGGAE